MMQRRRIHYSHRSHARVAAQHHPARRWLMIILCIAAAAYFILITSSAARGSQLRHLSQQQRMLQRETQELDLNIASESSVQQLHKRVQALGLQPLRRVEYASAEQHELARQ